MFWDHGLTSAATGQTVIFDTSAILQDTPLFAIGWKAASRSTPFVIAIRRA